MVFINSRVVPVFMLRLPIFSDASIYHSYNSVPRVYRMALRNNYQNVLTARAVILFSRAM